MNPAITYLYNRYINSPSRWHPFLAIFYLTYRCDFRCPYCSNGAGEPFYRLSKKVLPAGEVLRVLGRIRKNCEYLVITGGEPLKHPEFGRVMEGVREHGFRDVALNTNGYDVDSFLPQLARSVDTLIFSLDTLDVEKANKWFGIGGNALDRIMANIRRAADYAGRKYRIVISSVATARNIPDLYEVYDFAHRNGFIFAACPELRGVKAPRELYESCEYRNFYSFLISEKKKGQLVHGTPLYLRYMRDFAKFSCQPFTMLVVDPLGQVFYPCLEIGHAAGNILASSDLHALRRTAARQFGPQPECDVQCHSACALGFSLILKQPDSLLQEVFCTVKGFLNRRKNGSSEVLT
jgi:MoaA/NifB/PqqE/SkfB family radical SAM enzyme